MRLGDLDALKDDFECVGFNDYDDFNRALRIIDNAQTVEPETMRLALIDDIRQKQMSADKAFLQGYEKGYEKGKNERTQGGWIPVDEGLPEALQSVLVTSKSGRVYTSYIAHGDWEYGGEVVAWQPLPEPYKEGGAE